MPETEKGPLLTDETFFHSCLDLNRPEMREVRHFAAVRACREEGTLFGNPV